MSEQHHGFLRGRKTQSLTTAVCVLAVMLISTSPAFATGSNSPTDVVVDVLVARPISAVLTVGGAGLFLICLPFAAASRSLKPTTDTLIAGPAKDLFTRPVGDLQDFLNY
jgi:hypothetical protein